ncbi:MAG: efflux RND transporter periplasmic adaptor subunit [Campylobacteraceae bacterium]|jgi:macrolide-specific efflux system membrane fusion protein|nr:efflux RND transporter periplasmic adaptor subunit [Campylobacteraceae bacterium]
MSIKKYKKPIVISLIALFVIAVYFLSFKDGKNISYMTEKVKRGDIVKIVSAVGEVGAVKLVNVGAQASGQIESLHVVIGSKVKKGDLIAKIDSTSQKNEVETTAAKLESFKSQLKSAEVALKMAESRYNRSKALLDDDALSKQDFENVENEYEMAKSKLVEITSLIKQTEISLETAKKNLDYTVITAPLDGTIVSLPVKVGQTVNAMMNTPTIAQIADLSSVEIRIEISEGDILKVKTGQSVKFSVLSDDTVYETSIKSIDPALTTLTNDKYSGVSEPNQAIYYYARAEIANKDENLRIGMTTQNFIEIGRRDNVLLIPLSAVYEKNGRKYVQILADNKPLAKEITVGLSDDLFVEALSGLNEGEEVITTQMSLQELKIKENEVPEDLDL